LFRQAAAAEKAVIQSISVAHNKTAIRVKLRIYIEKKYIHEVEALFQVDVSFI